MRKKIIDILKQENIKINNIEFETKDNEIIFFNNIKQIIKNQINIKFIDDKIKDILTNFNLNKNDINILKSVNWNYINNLQENIRSSKRNLRYYNDIIDIIIDELKLKNNQKEFNIQKDKQEKAKKFKIDIKFDYINQNKTTTVNDFILYFNQRLQHFSEYIFDQIENKEVIRISNLEELFNTNKQIAIIGLISNLRYTKNGHLIITLEDRSGQIECFLNKNKLDEKTKKLVNGLCLDEGIGIVGKCGDKIVWIDEIIISKPLENKELKKTKNTNLILTFSDLNIGDINFNYNSFYKFLDFINSKTKNEKLNQISKEIKYILISGNIISKNDNDNLFSSTNLKYKLTTKLLENIPKDKCIIITTGKNDLSTIYEPQPALNYNIANSLHNMENIILLSNPSIINIENDFEIFLHNNTSYKYYNQKIEFLKNKPVIETFKFLLDKKHLAPTHESTHYIPDAQNDCLKIEKIPDIFIIGNINELDIQNYKGCTIITNGNWNIKTQENNSKCVLINTKTRKTNILNFN